MQERQVEEAGKEWWVSRSQRLGRGEKGYALLIKILKIWTEKQ